MRCTRPILVFSRWHCECVYVNIEYLCTHGVRPISGVRIQQAVEQQGYNTNIARIIGIYVGMDVGEATQGQIEVTETAGRTLVGVLLVLLVRSGTALSLSRSHRCIRLLLNVDHETGQGTVRLPLGPITPMWLARIPVVNRDYHPLLALQQWLMQGLNVMVVQVADQSTDGGVASSSAG